MSSSLLFLCGVRGVRGVRKGVVCMRLTLWLLTGVLGESLCHRLRSVCGPKFHSSSVRAKRRTVEGRAGLVLDGVRGPGVLGG